MDSNKNGRARYSWLQKVYGRFQVDISPTLAYTDAIYFMMETHWEQQDTTITLDSETEARIREVANRAGIPLEDYVRAALMRQMELDEQRSTADRLDQEFQAAASDPLFLQDLMDIEQAFATADAQTARWRKLLLGYSGVMSCIVGTGS